MKKAVIFDMDGVLVNTEHFYFDRRANFLNELGIKSIIPKTQDFVRFVGLTNEMIWKTLVPEDDQKRKILQEKYSMYCKKHEACFTKLANHSAPKVFARLKSKKLQIAVASSSRKRQVLRMIKECKLQEYVDFIISGEECRKSKPDPEIYLKAISTLGVLPTEALAVEDSKVGIHSAKLAGLYVGALIHNDYYVDQSEADFRMDDLTGVLSHVII